MEQWCDEINARLEALAAQEKRYLRPRYSAGYGDFSIDAQPELVQLLDLPRKIGVTVTETKMLLPSKSVTAVVGISATPANCHASGCLSCEQADWPLSGLKEESRNEMEGTFTAGAGVSGRRYRHHAAVHGAGAGVNCRNSGTSAIRTGFCLCIVPICRRWPYHQHQYLRRKPAQVRRPAS